MQQLGAKADHDIGVYTPAMIKRYKATDNWEGLCYYLAAIGTRVGAIGDIEAREAAQDALANAIKLGVRGVEAGRWVIRMKRQPGDMAFFLTHLDRGDVKWISLAICPDAVEDVLTFPNEEVAEEKVSLLQLRERTVGTTYRAMLLTEVEAFIREAQAQEATE